MDNSTRGLDTPDDQDSGATRHFANPAAGLNDNPPQFADESERSCLRCDAEMVLTTAFVWASPNPLALVMRNAKSRFRSPAPTTNLDSATCPNCGYTELYAGNLEQLATMIEAYERDPGSN